jgi:hypothetical protein
MDKADFDNEFRRLGLDKIHDLVEKTQEFQVMIKKRLDERAEAEDRLHETRMVMLRDIQQEVNQIRPQMFAIADAKVLASQAIKDIAEHKEDHRWWWKTLVGASAGVATGVGMFFRNFDKISDWVNRFGKPPSH